MYVCVCVCVFLYAYCNGYPWTRLFVFNIALIHLEKILNLTVLSPAIVNL